MLCVDWSLSIFITGLSRPRLRRKERVMVLIGGCTGNFTHPLAQFLPTTRVLVDLRQLLVLGRKFRVIVDSARRLVCQVVVPAAHRATRTKEHDALIGWIHRNFRGGDLRWYGHDRVVLWGQVGRKAMLTHDRHIHRQILLKRSMRCYDTIEDLGLLSRIERPRGRSGMPII